MTETPHAPQPDAGDLPELFDTHCHLLHGELAADPDAAWERARAAGVREALLVGVAADSSRAVAAFAAERPGLHAAVGIHPNEAARATEADWRTIEEVARRGGVAAIGETGLDLYWDEAPLETQRRLLERHVELALELDLPLVLHLRDAYPLAAEILERYVGRGLSAVVHCFGGEPEEIHPFVDWGWPISFAGILTYGKAENVRQAARRTPLGQCLVETDCPWLTPAEHRGRTNEPAFVVATARRLAEVKELPFEEVAATTTANARRFFRV